MNKNQKIIQNQIIFNKAFTSWIENGAVKGDKDWQRMFTIINEVCLNVAKKLLKNKAVISDIEDKALDAACHIMEFQILMKKKPIEYLGAFCKGPVMNELWRPAVKKVDNTLSVEEIKEIRPLEIEKIYPELEPKEKAWKIPGKEMIIDENKMHDSTFIFELLWFGGENVQ